MVQSQDPRSERVLSTILALSGENKDALVGEKPQQPQQQLQPQLQQAFSAAGQAQQAQV